MKRIVLPLVVVFLIISCVPAQSIEMPTQPLTPSKTFFLTSTPRPTRTKSPSHTPAPSLTLTPTVTPSLTGTPQPSLTAHEWKPENLLFSMEWTNGDGCCEFPHPPRIILYADGNMFLTRSIIVNDISRYQVLSRQLSRQELCQNMNTLDQIGFLDYDPSTYVFNSEPAVEGGGKTVIDVNAWKNVYGAFDSLGAYVDLESWSGSGKGIPVILPALRNAYLLFHNYPEDGFIRHKSKDFGLWIMPMYSQDSLFIKGNLLGEWPFDDMSIKSIMQDNNSTIKTGLEIQFLKISRDTANEIYDFVGGTFDDGDTVYEIQEDGTKKYFYVFIRPLLPFEEPSATESDFSARDTPRIIDVLSCFPSDGVTPISTPLNP